MLTSAVALESWCQQREHQHHAVCLSLQDFRLKGQSLLLATGARMRPCGARALMQALLENPASGKLPFGSLCLADRNVL